MKKHILFFCTFVGIFSTTFVNAQIQLSAATSYLKGTGDNNSSCYGGGVGVKFLIAKTVAIGGGLRTFPKTTNNFSSSNINYSYTDNVTQAFGTLEVILSPGSNILQPYIGADLGLSINSHSYAYSNTATSTFSNTTTNDKSFVYFAPKIGLNLQLGPALGLFAQGSYGLTFGSGSTENTTAGVSLQSKPVDKYLSADLGIYIRLSGAKN